MKINKKNLQIIIDGPVGSGKSVGASQLAKKLGIFYINSGALLRTMTLLVVRKGYLGETNKFLPLLKKAKIEVSQDSKSNFQVLLDGENVTGELYSDKVDRAVAIVSAQARVRPLLNKIWRKIAKDKSFVTEGRDCRVVFPKADLKIYMTAGEEIRAKRVWSDNKREGKSESFDKILAKVKERDYLDMHRATNPLKYSSFYWLLDTSKMTPVQEIQGIINKLKEKKLIS